jgi:tetratricopeptide (TPR) repeat protein
MRLPRFAARRVALAAALLAALPVWAQEASPLPAIEHEAAPDRPVPPGDAGEEGGEDADGAARLSSEESVARFQQLLERRPLHAAAFTGLVKHYAEQGRLPDLVKDYEQKSEALPDRVELRILLCRIYLRTGQTEAAATLLEALESEGVDGGRDQSRWLVFKSEVYQRSGRLDAAKAVLAEALAGAKTVSEKLRLAEGLADLNLAAGDTKAAADVLVALAEEYRDNYLHRKRIADALAQRELHEPAVGQYRELLELTKDRTDDRCETLRQLGRSLERLQRGEEAIEVYTQAVNLLAGGHWLQQELHERIVSLHRAGGKLEELVTYCRESLARAPEQTGMRVLLADVLTAVGRPEEAKETLLEAVTLFPKDRALSEKRIAFLDRTGDAAEAAAEFERIIAQHPGDADLYISYGQFLAGNKQLDAARNQWKHVLHSELTDATLAHRLGALFEPHELTDDAVECYERAIVLNPLAPDSYNALARLWFFRGDRDQALAVLQRLAAANPTDASTHAAVAEGAIALGMTEEALAAITRACELAPQSVDYLTTKADLLVAAGQLEDALIARRAAIDLITSPGQQTQAINVLVSMYASSGKLADLRAHENQRLEANAGDVIALLLLARAADLDRDLPAAKVALDRLLTVDPTHEEGLHQLARLHEGTGDIDAAIDAYRRMIDMHPPRARQWHQAIADLRLRYGDRAGAIDTFTQIVQSSPGNVTVLKDVAEQLVRLGEHEKAIEYYEQCLRLQGDRHEIRLAYGNALVDAGRLEEALEAFKVAAMQKSDRDTAFDALGRLHETASRLGGLDELLDDLQQRVELDPDNTQAARLLANLLVAEFEYNRAMDLIDGVLRHEPRDAELHLIRAELLRRLVRFDEALESYRRILRMPDADRDYILGEMGKTCCEAGRLAEARAFWRQVGHKLYAGTLLRNNGLLSDAIEVLQEGIRVKPDDFGLHRNLIRTLAAAGRTDDALEAARRLLDLEPDNIANIRELAEAYLKRGNRTAAAEIAARLFSPAVVEKRTGKGGSSAPAWQTGGSVWAASVQQAWSAYGWGGGSSRNNIEAAVEFFQQNGLHGELEAILRTEVAAQPDNALLHMTAASVLSELGKAEDALPLLVGLESATLPIEYQGWLGQCSQRDYFRVQQYQLISSKPALRDARLAALDSREASTLTRDELIELAVIRRAQGTIDRAEALLRQALQADDSDAVALSSIVDLLVNAERFADAEPFAVRLVEVVSADRERTEAEMVERVRREFVRSLPLPLQLRVTEELLQDIARKWTLGQSFVSDYMGAVQVAGLFRAKLTLATVFAKTGRMEEARAIWTELAPRQPADSEGWTTLAGVAQLYDQQDLAISFYERAMQGARLLAGDPLLQRVYGSSISQLWYGGDEAIDSSFNKIVESFAAHDRLIDLYDFLRDTDQTTKCRTVAKQYDLYDRLKALYRERFDAAAEAFRRAGDDPLAQSVPYLVATSKLAELYDQTGDWDTAESIYASYLDDFPDELALLTTLGEAAEKQSEFEEALEWETKVVATKERLSRQARAWMMRDLPITPGQPKVLGAGNAWEWQRRWGRNQWAGAWQRSPLELSPSWMRIAELHLALDNVLAAGDAMQRAIGAAGTERGRVSAQVLGLIRTRQLGPKLLPVLRELAVAQPTDEPTQMAFAEALAANDRAEIAIEVYRRMLRRGVSNVGVLTQVRQHLQRLDPSGTAEEAQTLESLVAEVEANPADTANQLRLAKAYFYTLDIDKAYEVTKRLLEAAPHLEGLHDLMIEIHTVRNEPDDLIAALRQKIDRLTNDHERAPVRARLAGELLWLGRTDEALTTFKELADPRNPESYTGIGQLLHYFGRHDEAIEQFELATRSNAGGGMWGWGGDDSGGMMQVRSLIIRGDVEAAADKLLEAVREQLRQAVQMGGVYAMYGSNEQNHFAGFSSIMALEPGFAQAVRSRLEKDHEENPADLQRTKLLLSFLEAAGETERARTLMQQVATTDMSDQAIVMNLVDAAVAQRDFAKGIELARTFIDQQPKPKIPPGMPPQFAAMMTVTSGRNIMLCKLGDILWRTGRQDEALAAYREILDEQIDETRLALAGILVRRDRAAEAREMVEKALAGKQVPAPDMLVARVLFEMLEGDTTAAFDDLARAVELGEGQSEMNYRGNAVSVHQVATLATRTGQVDRFVTFMNQRIARNPNNWADHQLLASTLREAGRVAEAMEVLTRAAEVKSLRPQALQERIQWMEPYATAEVMIPLYRELLDLTEKQTSGGASSGYGGYSGYYGGYGGRRASQGGASWIRSRLGDLLWDQNQHDEALKVWTERSDANDAATHVSLGTKLLEKRDYDGALASFRKALELRPDNAAAHEQLIPLTLHGDDPAAATVHLREVFTRGYSRLFLGGGRQGGRYDPYGMSDGSSSDHQSDAATLRAYAWALAAVEPAEVVETDERREGHLALAALTGEWDEVERDVRERLSAAPHDPMLWSMLAAALERRGAIEEAIAAHEQIRRLNRTTIAQHRDQLKLVLAGKQVKEAAAGTMDSDDPAAAAGAMSYRGYGGGMFNRWNQPGSAEQQLAALYLRAGRFAEAERLMLVGSGGAVQATLPMLAQLMWRQGLRDRALELHRLSLILGGEESMLTVYASALAEAGRGEEAAELLIRAYGLQGDVYGGGRWAMMYGYNQSTGLQSDEEEQVSATLHAILQRSGQYEAALIRLAGEFKANPTDSRRGRLLAGLQLLERRYRDARETIQACRADRPHDRGLLDELLSVNLQLHDWEAAAAVLGELRKVAPDGEDHWRRHDAFIHLMRSERDAAVTAIEPDLGKPILTPDKSELLAPTAVLLAAGRYDELLTHLQAVHDRGLLDGPYPPILQSLCMLQGRHEVALPVAIAQAWLSLGFTGSDSTTLERLADAARAAKAAGHVPTPRTGHPEDEGLLSLVLAGPAEGLAVFERLVAAHPENINARRGLIFAAGRAHRWDIASAANRELIALIEPRRQDVWREPARPPLGEHARGMLESMKAVSNSASALDGNSGAAALLQQLLASDNQQYGYNPYGYSTGFAARMQYDVLWRNCLTTQLGLEAAAGDVEQVAAISRRLKDGGGQPRGGGNRVVRMYGGMSSVVSSFNPYLHGRGQSRWESGEQRDWQTMTRQALSSQRQYAAAADQLDAEGAWLPMEQWQHAAATFAAAGRSEEASRWRRRTFLTSLVTLRSSEAPSFTDDRYQWGWYRSYEEATADEDRLRRELRHVAPLTAADPFDEQGPLQGDMSELWQAAVIDPEVAAALTSAAEVVGPGWGTSATLGAAQRYLRATGRADEAVAMFDRVFDLDELLGSESLGDYLSACVEARRFDQVKRAVDAVAARHPSLSDDVQLVRLAMMRHQGTGAEADSLEQELLSRCRYETPNPARLADELLELLGEDDLSLLDSTGYNYYNRGSRHQPADSEFVQDDTILALAGRLAVNYEPEVRQDDLTIDLVYSTYARHGLYADAARIVGIQLARDAATASPRRRAAMAYAQAGHLARAGRPEEARQAVTRIAAWCEERSTRRPYDARPRRELVELYSSPAAGPDWAAAQAAHAEARAIDPLYDADGLTEATILFETGRYADAWARYDQGMGPGRTITTDGLYRAGIAGMKAGATDRAAPLLRAALWNNPGHKLASQAKELIHE